MGKQSKTAESSGPTEICSIRIELPRTDPLIWREVEVPTSIPLQMLHEVIQAAMGWYDSHLWEFTIARETFGLPSDDAWGDGPANDAAQVCLRDVLRPRRTRIDYLYDFGDSWEHRLTVTRIRAGEPGVAYPRYVGGEWNGPPEDCGGTYGFYDMLEALADPKHPQHEQMSEWYDDYDPKELDAARIAAALAHLAKPRKPVRTRRVKKPA